MRVITIKRTIRRTGAEKTLTGSQALRDSVRNFFANESHWEFIIEALLFGILLAVSAWPIIAVAVAITDLWRIRPG
jgi:hypothetical protein